MRPSKTRTTTREEIKRKLKMRTRRKDHSSIGLKCSALLTPKQLLENRRNKPKRIDLKHWRKRKKKRKSKKRSRFEKRKNKKRKRRKRKRRSQKLRRSQLQIRRRRNDSFVQSSKYIEWHKWK